MLETARWLWIALLVGGCASHAKTPVAQAKTTAIRVVPTSKVDILFMIDNSNGIAYKTELKKDATLFFDQLTDSAANGFPAWYHIGVVTSDLGAGPQILGNGACTPGGQGGKLQPLPSQNSGQANCMAPGADTSTLQPANYIDFNQVNGTSNLPAAQDIKSTFTCMASVGGQGCGFEHQLESVYVALHDMPPENAGFLRDDAILVVIYASDEDDCSAPPDTDLFDPAQTQYGVANSSFRCTQFGLEYGDPPMYPLPNTAGVLTNVQSAPSSGAAQHVGHLWDLSRYTDFFGLPKSAGGVKAYPDDVILMTISPPAVDDSIEIKVTTPCDNNMNIASCPVLGHGCHLSTDPANFFGDPAVRTTAVIHSLSNRNHSIEKSLCEPPYADALLNVADQLKPLLKGGCVVTPLAFSGTHAKCTVSDVSVDANEKTITNAIKECTETAPIYPCWKLVTDPICQTTHNASTGADETDALRICREATCDPQMAVTLAPANTTPTASCELAP